MDKYNNLEALRIIDGMLERNGINFNFNTKNRIIEIYNSLMNNETNKNKSLEMQSSMIEDIVYSKLKNEEERFIFQRYSDVKHLEYLDTFAGSGETQKLLDILREKNISVDVLKGIKYALPMNNEKDKSNKDVEISQTFSPDSPPELENFEVKYKGETIYSFDGKISEEFKIDKNSLSLQEQEELKKVKSENYKIIKEIKKRVKKQKRKSKSKGFFNIIEEKDIKNLNKIKPDIIEAIEFSVKQKVRKAYRDVKTGRFVSVKNKKLF